MTGVKYSVTTLLKIKFVLIETKMKERSLKQNIAMLPAELT